MSCAEGDTGYIYGGKLRLRGRRGAARQDAEDPGEDRDERRQPAARLRLLAAAQRGRGPRAPGIHHLEHHRHPSQGVPRVRPPAAGPEGAGRPSSRAATRTRCASTWTRSPRACPPSPPRSGRRRSSCGCRTSSPTSTATSSAAPSTSPTRRTRCSGFRGASRYIAPSFRECFKLECEAMKQGARRDGPHQRGDHDPVRAHAEGGRAGARRSCARTAWSAARTACAS